MAHGNETLTDDPCCELLTVDGPVETQVSCNSISWTRNVKCDHCKTKRARCRDHIRTYYDKRSNTHLYLCKHHYDLAVTAGK